MKLITENGQELVFQTLRSIDMASGDVIVLSSHDRLSPEGADRLRAVCHDVFPKTQVLILDGGMSLDVLRSGWIPVRERLPEADQDVLFVVDEQDPDQWHRGRVLGGRYFGGGLASFTVPGISFVASHWKPSPPAPRGAHQ